MEKQVQHYPENVLVSMDALLNLRNMAGKFKLTSRKKSSAIVSGSHVSAFRGRGIDFSEVRLYQPGDDIRSIDWRVTARTNKTHTKLYTDERERPVFFVIDTGASMQFGTRVSFKSVLAAKIAGLLAWSVVSHGDRVGGILFAGNAHEEIKPSGGKRGILKLFNRIIKWNRDNVNPQQFNSSSNFYDVLVRLKRIARPGSLVYVISDFLQFDNKSEIFLSGLANHCDIALINIYDALEAHAPPSGNYMITDGESVGQLSISSVQSKNHFTDEFNLRVSRLEEFCKKFGLHFISIGTHEDLTRVVMNRLVLQKITI